MPLDPAVAQVLPLQDIPRAAEPCDPRLDWRPVRDALGLTLELGRTRR
jgi:hypothetical protein